MRFRQALLAALLICYSAMSLASEKARLSEPQLQRVGEQIFLNETGGNLAYLVAWNRNEAFASVGIGHFIWFPKDSSSPFTESFPDLLAFMQSQGVLLPKWLTPQTDCPWQSKAAFENAKHSKKMGALRDFLESTIGLQTQFIHRRMQNALPKMLSHVQQVQNRDKVSDLFLRLASTERGSYSLIDYVNFKGEGTSLKERYNGDGWGLLQVLLSMDENTDDIHRAFSLSCERVLRQRVHQSPQKNIEQQWLNGWLKRCKTYQDF